MDDNVIHHPLYGTLPLVPFSYGLTEEFRRVAGLPSGSLEYYWRPDPNFKPDLPPGAVRGDPTKQEYDVWGDVPRYFYLDSERKCKLCGRAFVFYARQQRYVYELLRCNFNYTLIRCTTCRRQRSRARVVRRELSEAVRLSKKNPTDAAAQLRVARAMLGQNQLLGEGKLDRALAATRRAAQLDGTNPEPLYWEAVIQSAAQQPDEALRLYRKFVTVAGHDSQFASLVEVAQTYITYHAESP